MKKTLLIIFALIQFLASSHLNAQSENQALIFVVDVSKSMLNPPGFYNALKENIKRFIKNDVQINDLVTIYSFGDDVKIISDVTNYKINGAQDIERLSQYIDDLQPTDNNTFLTKAIDILATQMGSIQAQYSDMLIKAFLFTDGKNDPPSGKTSFSLREILEKHNATFQNPFTYTYIITLGTDLDPELQEKVNDPESGIQGSVGDKDPYSKSVRIIPSHQKLKINSSENSEVLAQFQFMSIKNIQKASLIFTLETSSDLLIEPIKKEIKFTQSSTGKSFNIPIKILSSAPLGKYNLKYKVSPVNGNFIVTPKEVTVELTIQGGLVEIIREDIRIEATPKDEKISLTIKGENKSQGEIKLVPILEQSDFDLIYEKDDFTVPAGVFQQKIEFKLKPKPVGDYKYVLTFETFDQNVQIKGKVNLTISIIRPFDWGPLLNIIGIILGLLIIGALLFIICKWVLPKFPDNLELFIEDKNTKNSLGNYLLAEYKKFCFSSVTIGESKNIDIDMEGTILKLSPIKSGIKVKVLSGEVWDQIELEDNLYSEGKTFTISLDSEILTNSKRIRFDVEDDFEDENILEA